MMRSKRLIIVFILFFVLGLAAFSQDTQSTGDKDKGLREEILRVFKSGGEQGLRDYVKEKGKEITGKFIVDFTLEGMRERIEEWLKIGEIMAEEKNDDRIRADVSIKMGDYFRTIMNYERAHVYYDKAFSIYVKLNDYGGQGRVFTGKGTINYCTNSNESALEMFDRALPLLEKGNDSIGLGVCYLNKGLISYSYGLKEKALEMYDLALYFFEKKEYLMGIGHVYNNKGLIFFDSSDYFNAIEMYDKALFYFSKTDFLIGQANIFKNKADIYCLTGDYSNAEKMNDLALSIFKKLEDPLGQGDVFELKGNIYFFKGDGINALKMYDMALFFFEKTSMPTAIGVILADKGDIFLYTGDLEKAEKMYDRALDFFNKVSMTIHKGDIFRRKGNVCADRGDYDEAEKMYEKALTFFKKMDDPLGQGNVYLGKGDIYYNTGNYMNAEKMYDKALLFFEKANDPIGLGNVYSNKGDIYFRYGDNVKALDMYNKSFTFFLDIGIYSGYYALYGKAKVLEIMGKKAEAFKLFENSITNLERVRTQTAVSELKRTFLKKVYDQYEKTVLFMLKNKYYEKGFTYAESMKARVFLDQMAEGLLPLEKGMKPELKEEKERLVGKLSALSRQMQETGSNEEKKLQELKGEYRKFESEFDDLLIKIRLENPLYAAVNYPQPLSVQYLQKEILKDNETLLSYFISPDESYAFVISKDNFSVEQLKLKEKEVNGLINRYLLAIKENNANIMKKYGSILYEKLFMPMEKYLTKNSDIIIVPAGQLETIPFESFIIDQKKTVPPVYLLEKYRLKYVQSATLLSILRKYYTGDSNAKGFIGFGDPVYDYENFNQNKPEQGSMKILATESTEITEAEIKEIHRDRFARAGGIMDRLPHSGEEIQTISRLFEKESPATKVYLREQAAEENARADIMKDFAYIHFSCHGLLNDDFQCLVLSQLPGAKEDGYFTLNEIMNCDYNAKLIVLSACRTGSGKMVRGEGITGLTRAFMYAGSPAVVASLWEVDDAATKELMVKFYRNMLEKNLDKVEALRQAKLELLKAEKYSSPLFWSAFVMYGE
ncbi:MAG TPA: CHAT domain-containing protein [Candidatus Kapabacteria bacterium]|nr:CHAT domain-containing protein [Candidatus Kapabacteria bacterium]